jgi:PiT family inorganic phosphate transporter
MPPQVILVIVLALVFDFLNGVHGSSNILATMISSRAFRPWVALTLTAFAEFVGPFLFGLAVARTIGAEVFQANSINLKVLEAALTGAILWNLLTWSLGLPSSSSQGLIGGLLGAVLVSTGMGAVRAGGLIKVFAALFAAPLIGFGLGFLFIRMIFFLARDASPRINEFFKRSQLLTASVLALSHGANDAQKAMGIIVLSLVTGGVLSDFRVPLWVVTICAAGMALGTALSGWRFIRTLGGRYYKIRPIHSFSAQAASAIVILISSLLGWPVSTTQVASSAIIGVGSSERLGKVRWGAAGEILVAWLMTIPSAALVSAGVYWLITKYTL